jgi:3-oxoacyl-[acyl-carrier protein] reductase
VDLHLSGKRAFITGGSAGIGLAVARHLRAEDANVAICGRDQARLDAAVTTLGGPDKALAIQADVMDPQALAAAVDGAAERMGGLDLLVANAGGAVGGDLMDSTPEDWMATYTLNVLHAAHAVRVAVPHLGRADGGAVVIVASITGWKPGPRSSYATAKAAEIHLAAVLAQELAPYRVRINVVSPGSTYFPGGGWDRFGQQYPDQLAAFARDEFPAGRLLHPDEIADAICFLLSERAGGINGAHIPVDAGQGRPSARTFSRPSDRD